MSWKLKGPEESRLVFLLELLSEPNINKLLPAQQWWYLDRGSTVCVCSPAVGIRATNIEEAFNGEGIQPSLYRSDGIPFIYLC